MGELILQTNADSTFPYGFNGVYFIRTLSSSTVEGIAVLHKYHTIFNLT